ncbi:MAG: MATE family efflux transporter [Myxococcota bacterium]
MEVAPAQPPAVREGELVGLWRLALPLALAQMGQALMGLVDTAVLGRVSAEAQAAAGLGNSLTFTVSYFGMGVMLALDPLVAQAVGARDEARARTWLWQGTWLAGVVAVPLMLAVAVLPTLLAPFGVEPALAAGAGEYMRWRVPGVPLLLLFIGARSYLQGVGRPAATFWAMVLANIANLALDVLLVFGAGPIPALGVTGAAIATTVCTGLQYVVLLLALRRAPEGTQRRPDKARLTQAAALGLPIGLHFLAESGLFSLAGVLAGRLGAQAVAAHQVVLTTASVTFCVAVGIGSAAATRVGWGVGAKDTRAARRAGFTAFASVVGFMCITSLIFLTFPRALGGVLSTDSAVIDVVVTLFVVAAVFQVSDGVQAVGAGALRGAGDTRFTLWANLVGHWLIGLPVAVLLGVKGSLGVVGLWWGLSAGLTAVAVALLVRFHLLTRASITPAAER